MPRKKKTDENSDNVLKIEKDVLITGAVIKDDYCHYSYDVNKGVGLGDVHNVKGTGIIEDDMKDAFQKMNVHLAIVDDVFKHSKIEILKLDPYHNHEFASLYRVNGFKTKGTDESMSIILMGTKYLTSGGHMELVSPKIPLDQISSYPFWKELKAALEDVQEEVELYRNGKYIKREPEETENPKQLSIADALRESENADNELANARV
jgi:hypothetical protein